MDGWYLEYKIDNYPTFWQPTGQPANRRAWGWVLLVSLGAGAATLLLVGVLVVPLVKVVMRIQVLGAPSSVMMPGRGGWMQSGWGMGCTRGVWMEWGMQWE